MKKRGFGAYAGRPGEDGARALFSFAISCLVVSCREWTRAGDSASLTGSTEVLEHSARTLQSITLGPVAAGGFRSVTSPTVHGECSRAVGTRGHTAHGAVAGSDHSLDRQYRNAGTGGRTLLACACVCDPDNGDPRTASERGSLPAFGTHLLGPACCTLWKGLDLLGLSRAFGCRELNRLGSHLRTQSSAPPNRAFAVTRGSLLPDLAYPIARNLRRQRDFEFSGLRRRTVAPTWHRLCSRFAHAGTRWHRYNRDQPARLGQPAA